MRYARLCTLALIALGIVRADAVVTLCSTDTQSGGGVNLRDAIAGGGRITFACPAGAVIRVTQRHNLDNVTEVDGGGQITLDAGGTTSVFISKGGLHNRTLALRRLTIRAGKPDADVIVPPGLSAAVTIVFTSSNAHAILDSVNISDTERPVYVAFGTLTVSNCRFSNNTGPVLDVGTNVDTVNVSVNSTVFDHNSGEAIVSWNGNVAMNGIEVAGRSDSTDAGSRFTGGAVVIKNSRFHDIWSGIRCGGALQSTARTTISNTTFTNNRSNCGGGAVYLSGAPKQALLTAVVFESNQSGGRGGALAMDDADAAIEIRNGEFRNNRGLWGGAVSLYGSSNHPALAASALTFKNNSTDLMGGAIYVEGGTLQLGRGIFVDNRAPKGGILQSEQSRTPPAVLANLLMARNTGMAAILGTTGSLINSTIAGNTAAGLLLTGHLRAINSVVANNSTQNCQFSGAGALDNGGSNVQFPGNACGGAIPAADPMLDDFYVPAPQSPLENAGLNAVCLAAPVFARDVYGQQRPRATNCTIGAVEGDIDQLLHHLGVANGDAPPLGPGGGVCETCRKRTLWLTIAVVFLLIALLLVLWHFLRRRHHMI
jgi:predicted outer membrane repeat protein